MKRFLGVILLTFLTKSITYAQNDTVSNEKFEFEYVGYFEAFYSPNKSPNNQAPFPIFSRTEVNHNRSNSIAVNLALGGVRVKKKNFRANLVFQGGSYVTDNYLMEEPGVRIFHEANVMFTPFKSDFFWIEAGILPSFIGAETAIGGDSYTLTRNYISENTPYYLSGAAMRIETQNLIFRMGVYNGWENITRIFDDILSYGAQAQVKFDFLKLNYSFLMGRDFKMREGFVVGDSLLLLPQTQGAYNHNNLYADISPVKGWNILMGYDFTLNIGSGAIERVPMTSFYITNRIVFSKVVAMANRFETFKSTLYSNYSDIWAVSTNLDFTINRHVLFRTELRHTNLNPTEIPREGNLTGYGRLIFALIGRL